MPAPAPTARANGAIVKLDPISGTPTGSIPFQFNPASVRRTLQPSTIGGQPGGHSETVRFTGAPNEVFALEIELDAYNDGLPTPVANGNSGLYPMLYALETLIYPPVSQVQAQQQQLAAGVMEVAPIPISPVLLVWGSKRVVPVALQSFSIVEQSFDTQLTPLRAVVSLTARVLSYSDMVVGTAACSRFIAYQQMKENLAQQGLGTPPPV
jgi:hypothetical protein